MATTAHPLARLTDGASTRPKRLLIVTTVSATLGAFLFPFADHFRALGWKVDAMANGASTCPDCALHFHRCHDANWSRSPFALRNLLRLPGLFAQVRAAIATGYDIVHVHTPVAAFVTRLALVLPLAGSRPRVVYTAHGFHFQPGNRWFSNLIYISLERLAGRWTDYLITINQADELAAHRLALVPPGHLFHMPGIGLDRDHFRPDAVSLAAVDSLRIRLGIPAIDPVFVMIAEFIPRKRQQDALLALPRLTAQNCHLVFVGDGPCRPSVETLTLSLGLSERVHFAGQQEDVRPFIRMARAVFLTSEREGLPRSLMESLSCGIPVIGSDIRGIRDLVTAQVGKLFPMGDIPALASAFAWFLEHPPEGRAAVNGAAAHMGELARRGTARYSISHILRLHEELYAKL